MQKVSKEYKEAMKSSLRERAYIMLSFGLINQEVQANASIDEGNFTYFSNSNIFSGKTEDIIYATLEENFAKVDGSMVFPPRENNSNFYYNVGLVGQPLISQGEYELTINLNIGPINFRGLTINFGENYPVDFDIEGDNSKVIKCRNNSNPIYSTEEVFENVNYIKLTVYTMKNLQSRLRIYSVRFGYGLTYYNDDVISSTLESYVSPIGEDAPQIDFSVQLKNYDRYFNVDNPKSAINFLESGQKMQIYYGYQLPNSETIEWIKGNELLCSDWESDDQTATIRCQDVFRAMDSEYYKGIYDSSGKSYFELATMVMQEAGITDYYIDPRLKNLYTKNPIPRVPYREALQIIANACRCVLSQTRDGKPKIKSSFIPEATISTNGETKYSNVNNILNSTEKDEYGTFAADYTTVDGKMYFMPRGGSTYINTGYISSQQSDANGRFNVNPMITIVQEASCMYYGIKLSFGEALPSGIIIRTYNNSQLVSEYEVKEEITKTLIILQDFDDFDTMQIEFTKTAKPFNRIILNHFAFGDVTDFTMTRKDMINSPKAIKQELVKEVIIPCFSYQQSTTEESLLSEEITISTNETVTFFLESPCYNFRVTLNESASNVSVVSYGSYYITIKFKISGTFKLEIFGYKYQIVERYVTKSLNAKGKTIKWENPLISDINMAADLAEWLGAHYLSKIEYEYNTRGNPEIDANDIIYQENDFQKDMKVNVYRYTISFNQSFSGKVTARRLGG